MKKTVKFSEATSGDNRIYFTAVIIPKNRDKAEGYVDLIKSSVLLCGGGDRKDITNFKLYHIVRSTQVETFDGKIIIRILYSSDSYITKYSLKEAKDDSSRIIEQIETMIDALEEE